LRLCALMAIYRQATARLGRQHIDEWRRHGRRALLLLLFTTLMCAVGLAMLDAPVEPFRVRFLRGLWNAMNLITTLGDFSNFDMRQKVFMLASMVIFILIGGYAMTQLTGLLSSEAVMAIRENRSVKAQINALSGHVILIGFGPLGRILGTRLRGEGESVVVMEGRNELVSQASAEGYPVVQAEAGADDDTLKLAGLNRARACVIALDEPDRKVALTLMVHSLNPRLKIAVTAANHTSAELLKRAGATEVVIAEDLIAGALLNRLGQGRAEK
jgi:voltage-gated potassium channel